MESGNPDFMYILKLFKNILDVKLGHLMSEIIEEKDSIKRRIKNDVTMHFANSIYF
jgi:hypothetical protein